MNPFNIFYFNVKYNPKNNLSLGVVNPSSKVKFLNLLELGMEKLMQSFKYETFVRLFTINVNYSNKEILDHYFIFHKYYLSPYASEEEFLKVLKISKNQLRDYSMIYHATSFQDLINEFRFKYFLNEFEKSINAYLSIDTVIKSCGFESSQSFFEYVKQKQNN